jgi:muramoyltetrapeptide carboxypeptidase
MDLPTTTPPALQPGATIGIIAPAGPSKDFDALRRGIASLESMGFSVRFDERIFDSSRYLAGTDVARAEELMRCFDDPEIDAIIPLRGGYGCSRLVPLLDDRRLRHSCKIFMGFSDITTLHLFFRRRLGWVTVHGPMAISSCLGSISQDQRRHLMSLLTDPAYRPTFSFPQLEPWVAGSAEGKLVGGCLSVVVASLGTPYEIKTEGKILFLEDVDEPAYRIDRMLTHLKLAGKLDCLAGILLGSFLDCKLGEPDYPAADALRDVLTPLGVPLLAGFPAGHGPENWAIPLGVRVHLNADERRIEFLESAVH